ncbi:Rab family GTPase [Entamoeba histolytica HM-1:IMSS-B]|uniref:Rab family GTPase n=6 Tax=Entamoeba histolytica TaxID=5759 RepID=A0A8U0WQ13_ENTH1|eukprot:XP_657126.1 Rab family GTPase [Entamoeba histolytica HM-1:IMSS]
MTTQKEPEWKRKLREEKLKNKQKTKSAVGLTKEEDPSKQSLSESKQEIRTSISKPKPKILTKPEEKTNIINKAESEQIPPSQPEKKEEQKIIEEPKKIIRLNRNSGISQKDQQQLQKDWKQQIAAVEILNIQKKSGVAPPNGRKSFHQGTSAKHADMKFIVLGESGVGKTSLITQYVDNLFTPVFVSTVGVDFKKKEFIVDGTHIVSQIWDTAGQERFRTIIPQHYRGVCGVIFVVDVTLRTSFEQISFWINDLKTKSDSKYSAILCGNKIDSEDRIVTTDEMKQLADKNGLLFIETSAKNNTNVTDLFITLARDVLVKQPKIINKPPPAKAPVRVHQSSNSNSPTASQGGCC